MTSVGDYFILRKIGGNKYSCLFFLIMKVYQLFLRNIFFFNLCIFLNVRPQQCITCYIFLKDTYNYECSLQTWLLHICLFFPLFLISSLQRVFIHVRKYVVIHPWFLCNISKAYKITLNIHYR